MKNKYTKLVLLALLTFNFINFQTAFAQVPQAINFQAIARDGSGNPMVNTNIQIRLSVVDSAQSGTIVYQELRALQTNAYGSFSFLIGVNPAFTTIGTFPEINWETGNKHLKIDYDPTNTFSFSLTLGTIRFVTVPYAFSAETVAFIDATNAQNGDVLVYNSTTGKFEPGQVSAGTVEWSNVQNKPNFATVATSGSYNDLTNTPTIPANVSAFTNDAGYLTTESDNQQLSVSTTGDTLKLHNGGFVIIPGISVANTPVVNYCAGVTPPLGYGIVSSAGRCWLDRNLGATAVATSSTDVAAYGDLYQWGRLTDGHQIKTSATTTTLSTTNTPGNSFILSPNSPYDWRSPQNDNLWLGVAGVNNPCPNGYRIPTATEWNNELASWSSNNTAGAFASPLKLPVAGYRDFSDGSLSYVGSNGNYWSSSVDGAYSQYLNFNSSNAIMYSNVRAHGFSVRCIKD